MLQTPETIKGVKGITDQQRDRIKAFLQGAVYCLCNSSHKHDWFSVRDFLGGENYYWQDTPLSALYEYYMACTTKTAEKPGIPTAHLINSNPTWNINIFKTEKNQEPAPLTIK